MISSFLDTLHGAFGRPIFLTLLLILPLIWWIQARRRQRSAIRFSTLAPLRKAGTTWAVRGRHIVPILRTLAIVLLIICLARPQKGDEETRIYSEGIAIQLLVDRSSSMLAEDFTLDGKRVNRLEAVKAVADNFVLGDDDADLPGRPDDLVGMIAFAGYADSFCPLTLDHAYLADTLAQTKIVEQGNRDEDGTAIGDAIALAVLRMRDLTKHREALQANRVKSKVLVLLTDGEQTRGDLTPEKGAELAKTEGIKIYTIGVGTRGMAPMPWQNPFTGRMELKPMPVSIDEDTLKRVAEATGGEYFRATDTDSLRKIYKRIDELEKTKTEEKRYLQTAELATQAVEFDIPGLPRWLRTTPPLLLVVLGLLGLEIVLANTRFRKIP
ncbi:MAG TPA: VWA domain-containing protein [Phycisphaerae bacterium]|nr:VWA domain-containing protein [Phycisphaerae bacterium]